MDITKQTNYIVKSESIDAFLRTINSYEILSASEEKEIFLSRDCAREAIKAAKESLDDMEISLGPSINSARKIANGTSGSLEAKNAAADYVKRMESEIQKCRMAVNETVAKNEKIIDDARKRIMEANQRFVFAVAKRYDNTDRVTDLVNEGNLGVAEAFESYNLSENNRFLSYAVWLIRRAIYQYITSKDVMVRSTNNAKVMPKLKKINSKFFAENGRYPSIDETVELLHDAGYDIKNPNDIFGAKIEYIESSIDTEDDECTFENSRAFNEATAIDNEYEEDVEHEDLSEKTSAALKLLSERERKIVTMSTGIGYNKQYSNSEIGEVLGLTAERVRQIYAAALNKMKVAYTR